jgi:hypothetical protein
MNSMVHHRQCCSNMKQRRKTTESNKCHFTMCLLVLKYVYYVLTTLNMTFAGTQQLRLQPRPSFFFFFLNSEQANVQPTSNLGDIHSVGYHVQQKVVLKHLTSLLHCKIFITKLTPH